MIENTKVCRECHLEKDLSEFNKHGKRRNQNLCRTCDNSRSRKYYQENKQVQSRKINANKIRRRKELQDWIRKLKESNPCTDCGKYYPWYVMEYDHLCDKRDNIATMVSSPVNKDVLLAELEKCELVCSNCHRIRTFSRMK